MNAAGMRIRRPTLGYSRGVALLLAWLAVALAARLQAQVLVLPGESTLVAPGQRAQVVLSLSNVSGSSVAALQTDLIFDAARFTSPLFRLGASAAAAGKSVSQNLVRAGQLRAVVTGGNGAIANGEVLVFEFVAASGCLGTSQLLASGVVFTNPTAAENVGPPASGTVTCASGIPRLRAGSTDVNADRTGGITVSLENVPGVVVTALQVDLTFDATLLTAASLGIAVAAAGKDLAQNMLAPGRLRAIISGGTAGIPDGAVMVLTFQAAANCFGSVEVRASNVVFSTAKAIDLTGGATSGMVTCLPFRPRLTVGAILGLPGQTVALPISLQDVPAAGVSAVQADFLFDAGKLLDVTVDLGAAAAAANKELSHHAVRSGRIRAILSGGSRGIASGDLLRIRARLGNYAGAASVATTDVVFVTPAAVELLGSPSVGSVASVNGRPRLRIGSASVAPGQASSSVVLLENAPGLQVTSLQADLVFDSSRLTSALVAKASDPSAPGLGVTQTALEPGRIRATVEAAGRPLPDGPVMSLSFKTASPCSRASLLLATGVQFQTADAGAVGGASASEYVFCSQSAPRLAATSAVVAPGASGQVTIALVNSPAAAVSSVQCDVVFNAAQFGSLLLEPGAAVAAAGKGLSQNLVSTGRLRAILSGGTGAIADGPLLVVRFSTAAGCSGTVPIDVTGVVFTTPEASEISGAAAGSLVTCATCVPRQRRSMVLHGGMNLIAFPLRPCPQPYTSESLRMVLNARLVARSAAGPGGSGKFQPYLPGLTPVWDIEPHRGYLVISPGDKTLVIDGEPWP